MRGYDYTRTFSPTIRIDTLRVMLAIGCAEDWHMHQVDIVTAYLSSFLKECIYMRPPEGLDLPIGSVLLLLRALYGLKQSGRAWYEEIATKLMNYGLVRSESDWCLFVN